MLLGHVWNHGRRTATIVARAGLHLLGLNFENIAFVDPCIWSLFSIQWTHTHKPTHKHTSQSNLISLFVIFQRVQRGCAFGDEVITSINLHLFFPAGHLWRAYGSPANLQPIVSRFQVGLARFRASCHSEVVVLKETIEVAFSKLNDFHRRPKPLLRLRLSHFPDEKSVYRKMAQKRFGKRWEKSCYSRYLKHLSR